MLNRIRSHVARNSVAYLALFVALGGTSYGFASGSIDSREIRNNTIRTGDLRNNEVRSRDIRNRTIVGRDLLSNSLGGDQIEEAELGEIPLATRSKSADDALALDGQPPSAFAGPPLAETANVPDANITQTDLLQIPGFGLLRAAANACNTGAGTESFTLSYLNTTAASMESFAFTPAATQHATVASSGELSTVHDDEQSYIVLRLVPADRAVGAATATLFSNNEGSSCRVSLQVVVSP